MDFWTQVRRYVLSEGHSKREACRKFGVHWKTLQKMLDHPEPPTFQRRVRGERKIARFLPILHAMLEADRQAPPKQRHTAQRIYDRLRAEHQYDGKRRRNAARDQRVQRLLRNQGWRVMVIWECQIRDVDRLARRVRRFLG